MSSSHVDLRAIVVARMAELGLTAYAVAKRADISEDCVRKYTAGSSDMGSERLGRVLGALGIAVYPPG